MKMLELARQWFEDEVNPMLEKEFPRLANRVAAGLVGRGSECFGYDDEISGDHDYQVGVWLWIDAIDEREWGFALERAYKKLLKDHPPQQFASASSLLGGTARGVCVIGDFYRRHLGIPGAPEHFQEWLNIPEYAFAEAVNGEVFRDDQGTFSAIRQKIAYGMPEDVRLKKLAARAAAMAQSGQYNFMRCIKHGEPAAAQLALDEFVRNAISMIHLLNFRFAPYYKWAFRSLRELPILGHCAAPLQELLCENMPAAERAELIEEIAGWIINVLDEDGLSYSTSDYLENHAVEITQHIKNREIRAMHLMEG